MLDMDGRDYGFPAEEAVAARRFDADAAIALEDQSFRFLVAENLRASVFDQAAQRLGQLPRPAFGCSPAAEVVGEDAGDQGPAGTGVIHRIDGQRGLEEQACLNNGMLEPLLHDIPGGQRDKTRQAQMCRVVIAGRNAARSR